MSQFSVLTADSQYDIERWSEAWNRWPAREVFAHPHYLRLFGTHTEKAVCVLFESHNGTVLYPFFLRNVDAPYMKDIEYRGVRDIASPYGYGGPMVIESFNRKALAAEFWNHFDSWCERSNVISEFVRFTLFTDSLLEFPGEAEVIQNNVVRSLDLSAEELWMDFDHKVRKNVKKAQRLGVTIEVDLEGEFFDDFYRIYKDTMDRRSASSGYYFGEDFFRAIHESLSGQFAYFHARHEERIVSTELVLLSEENAYSFLGGTLGEAFDKRPNDLLKFEIMKWAGQNGKKRFVLGGGFAANDGIFKYKKAFAPSGSVPFLVGRRILNPVTYNALVEGSVARRTIDGAPPIPNGYFPAYRG
ncbi:GNAT family N-acetyltransferase [Pseudarthrobacter sp. H3Y2-7]|uniref:lipid II:glycine glycyltransferase FemX n=1 Tax=Pseudarthrobacter naphthalenicus TaxID=3031328 RepID=UPI0023B19E64|nr:GNAT family N-acetyltransferase [Pseudarthrobacter sp. H3Y2-7]MDE8668155.1 GNAT family N-acetyltransferase [Pseudarthrobacter sp. H3Y2-7]